MKRLFALILLCLTFNAKAFEFITATLTVTNGTTTNDSLTVSSYTRQGGTANSSSTFLTNSTANSTATNLLTHFGSYPIAGVLVKQTSSNVLTFAGVALTASCSNFASLSFATNTVSTNRWYLMLPFQALALAYRQTNASQLVEGIESFATNKFSQTASPLANYVSLGQSQGVTNKTLYSSLINGGMVSNAYLYATGGQLYSLTASSLVVTNLDAPGSGSQSQRIGDGATATGVASMAFGVNAAATNDGAIAIGQGTTANYNSVAIGNEAAAFGQYSQALGGYSDADYSTAIGSGAQALHTNSVSIGPNAVTTTSNQIVLGASDARVSIPGYVDAPVLTNSNLRGTNVFAGDVSFSPRSVTSLANGNNAGVNIGTNVYVKLSGASGAVTICGLAAGRDGEVHVLQFSGQSALVFAHESGLDPTAANRIQTPTGSDYAIGGNVPIATVLYDRSASRSRLISSSAGVTTHANAALMFTNTEALNLAASATYYTVTNYDVVQATNFTYNLENGTLTNVVAGTYEAHITMSFDGSGGAGDVFECAIFTNGVECTSMEWVRKTSSTDTGSASAVGLIYLPANSYIQQRIQNTTNTGSITIRRSALMLTTP